MVLSTHNMIMNTDNSSTVDIKINGLESWREDIQNPKHDVCIWPHKITYSARSLARRPTSSKSGSSSHRDSSNARKRSRSRLVSNSGADARRKRVGGNGKREWTGDIWPGERAKHDMCTRHQAGEMERRDSSRTNQEDTDTDMPWSERAHAHWPCRDAAKNQKPKPSKKSNRGTPKSADDDTMRTSETARKALIPNTRKSDSPERRRQRQKHQEPGTQRGKSKHERKNHRTWKSHPPAFQTCDFFSGLAFRGDGGVRLTDLPLKDGDHLRARVPETMIMTRMMMMVVVVMQSAVSTNRASKIRWSRPVFSRVFL